MRTLGSSCSCPDGNYPIAFKCVRAMSGTSLLCFYHTKLCLDVGNVLPPNTGFLYLPIEEAIIIGPATQATGTDVAVGL